MLRRCVEADSFSITSRSRGKGDLEVRTMRRAVATVACMSVILRVSVCMRGFRHWAVPAQQQGSRVATLHIRMGAA
jgi:hypothetical protein